MRAVVVLSRDGELAVALRERLDRAYVTVIDAAGDPVSALRSCPPWPWLLVGDVPDIRDGVVAMVRTHPVLLRWLGPVPDGMPRRCRAVAGFADLAESVSRALANRVGRLRLAVGAGVDIGGEVHINAELEALLGDSPAPIEMPRSRFRTAAALLRRSTCGVVLASSSQATWLETV